MKYSRGAVLFVLLGAIVVVVLVINPRLGYREANVLPPATGITIARPNKSVPMETPALYPSQTAATATLLADALLNPSATPVAYSPMQLQTIVAPQETLLPNSTALVGWSPPPLEVPLAYHPFDHYWLIRPVGSNNTNFGLGYYPYGSDGPRNDLRIHHGLDIANPIGVEVYAAGSGTVVWADKGHLNEYESITAYGNAIVVEHDFGYNGQRVYTLYAHLSAILVGKGEHVQAGQVIGLIGNTGQVTGPHVHFEVRIGRDSYYATRNPVLWMAPYVGTGVIAGHITFPDNSVVTDALIMLIDRASGRVIERTNSYAGFGVSGDDNWGENFVFADIPSGRYLVTSRTGTIMWSGEVNVIPGATNWVELERYTPEATSTAVEKLP